MDTKPDNPIAPPADERRDEEGFNGTTGGNVNLNLDEVHHDAAAPDHDGFPDIIQPIVFGGSGRPQPCEGCRVHRKRCDLTRPSCSRCIKRQVPCSYKPAPIKLRKRASERGSGQLDSSDGTSTTHIIPLNHSPTAASSREGSVASPLKSDVDVAAAHRILEASPSRLAPRPVEVVKISEQQIQLQQKQNLARMAAQKSLSNTLPSGGVVGTVGEMRSRQLLPQPQQLAPRNILYVSGQGQQLHPSEMASQYHRRESPQRFHPYPLAGPERRRLPLHSAVVSSETYPPGNISRQSYPQNNFDTQAHQQFRSYPPQYIVPPQPSQIPSSARVVTMHQPMGLQPRQLVHPEYIQNRPIAPACEESKAGVLLESERRTAIYPPQSRRVILMAPPATPSQPVYVSSAHQRDSNYSPIYSRPYPTHPSHTQGGTVPKSYPPMAHPDQANHRQYPPERHPQEYPQQPHYYAQPYRHQNGPEYWEDRPGPIPVSTHPQQYPREHPVQYYSTSKNEAPQYHRSASGPSVVERPVVGRYIEISEEEYYRSQASRAPPPPPPRTQYHPSYSTQPTRGNIPPPDTVTRVYQTEGRIAPSYVHSEPYYEYADGKGRNMNEGKVAVQEVLVDAVESVNERGDEVNNLRIDRDVKYEGDC